MSNALILLREWNESQIEFWLPVKNYQGYDVSNFGRVRSYWCRKVQKGHRGFIRAVGKAWKLLTLFPTRQNYRRVYLFRNGQKRSCLVHRLVAQAFVANTNQLPEINHLTGVKYDNRVDALEWANPTENRNHALQNGLVIMPTGMGWVSQNRKTFTVDDVRTIRQRHATGESSYDLGHVFGTSTYHIN